MAAGEKFNLNLTGGTAFDCSSQLNDRSGRHQIIHGGPPVTINVEFDEGGYTHTFAVRADSVEFGATGDDTGRVKVDRSPVIPRQDLHELRTALSIASQALEAMGMHEKVRSNTFFNMLSKALQTAISIMDEWSKMNG